MNPKRFYFRRDEDHLVAVVTVERVVGMMEQLGFRRCTAEEYLEGRWEIWNDVGHIDIEGRPDEKKTRRRVN